MFHVRSTVSSSWAAGPDWDWVFLVLALAPGRQLLLCLEQGLQQMLLVHCLWIPMAWLCAHSSPLEAALIRNCG